MLKKLFFLSLIPLMCAAFLSCDKKDSDEQAVDNVQIYRVPSPDEAYKALSSVITTDSWAGFINPDSDIPEAEGAELSFIIGMRSANALFAVFADDTETAQDIAQSIRTAALLLNIESASVEDSVAQLIEDFNNAPENELATDIIADLKVLNNSIRDALEKAGTPDYALLIQAGSWYEAMRLATDIISEDYSATAAEVLKGSSEPAYFKIEFSELNAKYPSDIYARLAETSGEIYTLIKTTDVNREDVVQMNSLIRDITESF